MAWGFSLGALLASSRELADFLAGVERRAFKHALFAVRDEALALDVVQDAMLKLAEKYSGKPAAEYPMLFQRILQNTVRDHFRRQKVRNFWSTLISSFGPAGQDQDHDPLETLEVKGSSNFGGDPAVRMEQAQTLQWIEEALEGLPARQRQAFLLRYWEDLDVSEAAAAMGCSEGSVKTHCFRAVRALAVVLREKGIEL